MEPSVDTLTLKGRRAKPQSASLHKTGGGFDASAGVPGPVTRSLVNGDSFAVFEARGDVLETPHQPLGFFHRDTRHLSRFELKMAGETPHYLDSHITGENAQLRVNLSNPDFGIGEKCSSLPINSISIERNWVIAGPELCHQVVVRNLAPHAVEIPLDFLFGADFADLFEVRGVKRSRRGDFREPEVARGRVRFRYHGLDGTK